MGVEPSPWVVGCSGWSIQPPCNWETSISQQTSGTSETESVTQSCPTVCDPVDCSPPGSSVHGVLPARILEWVSMPPPPGDLHDWETEMLQKIWTQSTTKTKLPSSAKVWMNQVPPQDACPLLTCSPLVLASPSFWHPWPQEWMEAILSLACRVPVQSEQQFLPGPIHHPSGPHCPPWEGQRAAFSSSGSVLRAHK